MNVRELEVHDYVRTKDVKFLTVADIKTHENMDDPDAGECKCLMYIRKDYSALQTFITMPAAHLLPLPINEDFLVYTGFKQYEETATGKKFRCMGRGDTLPVEAETIEDKTEGLQVVLTIPSMGVSVKCRYIHQLQHVLRFYHIKDGFI